MYEPISLFVATLILSRTVDASRDRRDRGVPLWYEATPMVSPYDDSWLLDNLAMEMQFNHPLTTSIVSASDTTCGGCGAKLTAESVDDRGRQVKAFLCGHKYIIGARTVMIERV